jgi:type VI secretion system secreted protein Hcp
VAAPNIHLEINEIPGDSEVYNYIGQIDCTSWSWGASQSANMHTSTGGAAAGSHVQDIAITKNMDMASPNLMQFCCMGTHIPHVTLACTKSGGAGGRIEWYQIQMKEVIISSVSQQGGGGIDMGSESVTLNFAQFRIKYYSQGADGSPKAGPVVAYNIRKAVEE